MRCATPMAASPDYFIYHQKIIAAEKLFLKDSIPASLKAYRAIFAEYKPFAKDAFIALELACMVKDTTQAHYFFEECFKAGVNWDIFDKVLWIKNILEQNSAYKNKLTETYWKERKLHYASIDIGLREYLGILSRKDDTANRRNKKSIKEYFDWVARQSDSFHVAYENRLENFPMLVRYRKKQQDSTSDYYKTLKRLIIKKYLPLGKYDTLFVKRTEINILALDSVSKMLGYVPGEKTIGIVDNHIDLHQEVNTLSLDFRPSIIHLLYHHGCGFWLMKNELYESVKRGEIHPRYYALLYDYSYCALKDVSTTNLSMKNLQSINEIKCPLPEKDKVYNIAAFNCMLEKADCTFVNKCRKVLSISSLQHDKKKIEYAKNHHLILFFGFLGVET